MVGVLCRSQGKGLLAENRPKFTLQKVQEGPKYRKVLTWGEGGLLHNLFCVCHRWAEDHESVPHHWFTSQKELVKPKVEQQVDDDLFQTGTITHFNFFSHDT
jgi:hypothetical protein